MCLTVGVSLYPNNGTKLIARSTTQDRMIQSSEYFLAGFFGLGWTDNATLVNNTIFVARDASHMTYDYAGLSP